MYAVEFSPRSGRDLINMAKKRTNVIPIIEDARRPEKYRMLVGMVDVVFADVAQPDQARIVAINSHMFLKNGGHFVISIKANCIDSTVEPTIVFAKEVAKLKAEQLKPETLQEAAAVAEAFASTDGVVTSSSIAESTPSQPRATISPMLSQRFLPARPSNCSTPPASRPRLGLPLKKRVTAGSSHTTPSDDTTAIVWDSASTDSAVGFSASSSSTAIRSALRSSAGCSLWALALVSRPHAGWSVRSLSLLVRTNAARSATDSKAKTSSSFPRKASQSSPSSRQRGAHNE